MRAIHVLRTPHGCDTVRLAEFEILTMALSALEWRAHNGPVTLVTDKVGASWARDHHLECVWSDVDESLTAMADAPIDEVVYWAAGKLFALRRQTTPCVLLDLDFIVWHPLDFTRYGTGVAAIHTEDIQPHLYPPPETFCLREGYALPGDLDETVRPINGALVYHGDVGFAQRYAQAAIDFMEHTAPGEGDNLPYMLFAEQRLLPMLAAKEGRPVYEIAPLHELFGKQKTFTHVWGYKDTLRRDERAREAFTAKLRRRLAKDFPEVAAEITKGW